MSCAFPFRSLFLPIFRKAKPVYMAQRSNFGSAGTSNVPSAVQPSVACVPIGEGLAFSASADWEKDVIGKPPSYAEPLFRPDIVKSIEENVDELNSELRELSMKIHDHPELSNEEHYAHDTLSEFMEQHSFEVTRRYCNIPTAWLAKFQHGSGGRTIGFNSEMDALPGVGHACGHNLIAIVGVGAAIALARTMKKHDVTGTIILLGTPAEETVSGKVQLIDAGAYKDMDVCFMAHPSAGRPHEAGTGASLSVQQLTVTYHGHTSHASAAPWEGKNALDAAFLAYSAISVLRQQIKPTHRVHGIVEGRDWAPNIIPDYAKMTWLVRAPTWAEVQTLRERVKKCLEAAALATDCQMDYKESHGTYDLRQNLALADEFGKVLERYRMNTDPKVQGAVGGSTDFGNVTYEVPAIHPSYSIPTKPNGGNHTVLFTESAATPEAHAITLTITKALGTVAARFALDQSFSDSVTQGFKDGKTTGPVS